jgi:hypothetical protein
MSSAEPKKKREKARPKMQPPEVVLIPVSGEQECSLLKRYLCSRIRELQTEKMKDNITHAHSGTANQSTDQKVSKGSRKRERSTVTTDDNLAPEQSAAGE